MQRCYYQPVTEYVRKSYYEPVTKNVTSYYYEPVTEYKYSTYYDPCTGCPQKVCTPCTSYRLRSQCNSVTSYVERCAMVPVTTLKPVTYQQPVVSYYYPPCPPPCPPASRELLPAGPDAAPARRSDEIRENPPGVVPAEPPGGSDAMIPPTNVPTEPQRRSRGRARRQAPPGEDRQPQQRGDRPRRGGAERPDHARGPARSWCS